jgi:hypothetical protein
LNDKGRMLELKAFCLDYRCGTAMQDLVADLKERLPLWKMQSNEIPALLAIIDNNISNATSATPQVP